MSPTPADDDARQHGVSVIIPVRNEELHLREAVEAALASDWPGPLEIVLAVGPSDDQTELIAAALAAEDSRVQVIENPEGGRATGLNLALDAAKYDTIARIDGHCVIPKDYLSVAMSVLEQTGASNVGGIMAAEGQSSFEQAVAAAMVSPLGVGSAAFHTGGDEGPALTVYLGVFPRAVLDRVGRYDPTFDRAEDWEMNHRIRSSGGVVWFTPRLRVTYRPRSSVRTLAQQYFHYGKWRRAIMRRYPETASTRYLAPPFATAVIVAGGAAGVIGTVVGRRIPAAKLLRVGYLAPAGYAAAIAAGSVVVGRELPMNVKTQLPAAIATMHLAWGWGFLRSPRGLGRN